MHPHPSALHYSRLQGLCRLAALIAQGAILLGLIGFDRRVGPLVPGQHGGVLYGALLTLAGGAAWLLVLVPIGYPCGYRLPARFGLLHATRREALRRLAAPHLAIVVGVAILVWLAAVTRTLFGPYWIVAAVLYVALLAVWQCSKGQAGATVRPGPERRPAPDDPAMAALERFAREQGFHDTPIRVLKASESAPGAMAATWTWPARPCVVLPDTTVRLLEPDERKAVLAHELGHRRTGGLLAHGVPVLAALVLIAAAFGTVEVLAPGATSVRANLRVWPTVLLVLWLLVQVIRVPWCALSRRDERRANAWALEATNDPAAFISAMEKLAAGHLIAGRPSWWETLLFATHPPLAEVVGQARAYARRHGMALPAEGEHPAAQSGMVEYARSGEDSEHR